MGGVTRLLPFFLRKALMTKAETTDIDYKQRIYEETLARQERLQAERERVDANSFPLENSEDSSSGV